MKLCLSSRRIPLLVLPLALLLASPAQLAADIRFTRLGEDQFLVHHRKKTLLGAEAKATRTAYAEAAAVCLAAGFTHMKVKNQNVGERMHGGWFGGGRGASADLRIEVYKDPDKQTVDDLDLIACEPLADPKKVEQAKRKLEAEPR